MLQDNVHFKEKRILFILPYLLHIRIKKINLLIMSLHLNVLPSNTTTFIFLLYIFYPLLLFILLSLLIKWIYIYWPTFTQIQIVHNLILHNFSCNVWSNLSVGNFINVGNIYYIKNKFGAQHKISVETRCIAYFMCFMLQIKDMKAITLFF